MPHWYGFADGDFSLQGTQAKLMLNAGIHKPDAIILDLEDSVSPTEKDAARLIVRNALRTLDFFGSERMVRINQGRMGLKDLDAIIPHNVHLVLVPKVENAKQLKAVDDKILSICKKCGRKDPVYLMPILSIPPSPDHCHTNRTTAQTNLLWCKSQQ